MLGLGLGYSIYNYINYIYNKTIYPLDSKATSLCGVCVCVCVCVSACACACVCVCVKSIIGNKHTQTKWRNEIVMALTEIQHIIIFPFLK